MTTETKATPASWLVEDMLAEQQRMKQAADRQRPMPRPKPSG